MSDETCGWQPMTTAPTDGTYVLVMVPGSDIEKVVSYRDEPKNGEPRDGKGAGWRMAWDSYLFDGIEYPTMWHSMPAAPKGIKLNGAGSWMA